MIMPVRKNVGVFFNNCLKPFFQSNYGNTEGSGSTAPTRSPPRGPSSVRVSAADPGIGLHRRRHLGAQPQCLLRDGPGLRHQPEDPADLPRQGGIRPKHSTYLEDGNVGATPTATSTRSRSSASMLAILWTSEPEAPGDGEGQGMLLFEKLWESKASDRSSADNPPPSRRPGDSPASERSRRHPAGVRTTCLGRRLAIQKIWQDLKDRLEAASTGWRRRAAAGHRQLPAISRTQEGQGGQGGALFPTSRRRWTGPSA